MLLRHAYPAIDQKPLTYTGTGNSNFIAKKKVPATIKTVDGQTLVGELNLRLATLHVKDELNSNQEQFIAVTGVKDEHGNVLPHTFLLNYAHIIYVVVDASCEASPDGDLLQTPGQPSRRRAETIIRTVDGKNIAGNIHIRNTINRAKDEINTKDGKFITVSEVKGRDNLPTSDLYFVNKDHVIYLAVHNDKLV